jgi:aminoglycoside N3'-acetyltransferase
LAKDGPIGRIVERDGRILMFCRIHANTSMHAGELWAGLPLPTLLCHTIENGVLREVLVPSCPWHSNFELAYERLYARGQIRDVPLGASTIHTMAAGDAIAAQQEVATENPETILSPGCACPFCESLKEHCRTHRADQRRGDRP